MRSATFPNRTPPIAQPTSRTDVKIPVHCNVAAFASAEPIGSETESVSGVVMPMACAVSMIFWRPALAARASWLMPIALPSAIETLIGMVLIDFATASHIGWRPE